ncbi:CBS domain-containing protein [Paenibacillus sp. MAH-36]|uniref:CBS domain-containing protein n=1 Tax=Paenibacillus violae TaxID=3077234 RepID=A0ABU3R8X3_9BACL|nr:CBS domain-containing protein [Paenibacillus sp. PFR10]MDU0200721.1 CBS domain-containing protein [Paenibacillus sp. PFR10]
MKTASFLFPKDKVAFIKSTSSMKEAMEQLEQHYYTALPIVDEGGKYVGTLSEGDLLWTLKNKPGVSFENMDDIPVSSIKKHIRNECVCIDAFMEDMLAKAADQNFVPVVDDKQIFLGIIRRKDIIAYYMNNITD